MWDVKSWFKFYDPFHIHPSWIWIRFTSIPPESRSVSHTALSNLEPFHSKTEQKSQKNHAKKVIKQYSLMNTKLTQVFISSYLQAVKSKEGSEMVT